MPADKLAEAADLIAEAAHGSSLEITTADMLALLKDAYAGRRPVVARSRRHPRPSSPSRRPSPRDPSPAARGNRSVRPTDTRRSTLMTIDDRTRDELEQALGRRLDRRVSCASPRSVGRPPASALLAACGSGCRLIRSSGGAHRRARHGRRLEPSVGISTLGLGGCRGRSDDQDRLRQPPDRPAGRLRRGRQLRLRRRQPRPSRMGSRSAASTYPIQIIYEGQPVRPRTGRRASPAS